LKPATAPEASSTPAPGWSPEVVMPYLWVLVGAVLLALGLRLRIYEDYLLIAHRADPLLDGIRTVLRTSFWIQFALFWWVALRRLPLLARRQRLRQRQLLLAALLATGMSLVNLLSESLAIYRLKLASYDLLFESSLLYGAITFNFLFWYWVIDHPPRDPGSLWEINRPATSTGVSMPYGIVFPEEALERDLLKSENWTPGFTDYLYFTILSSNCFGAPEGHSLVGAPIKRLHMLHSVVMLAVVIVILARAINTLG
jgi:hypothetical protein